ncbi:MAG: outer membrane beta-barrel protein [Leadbetterella sp.]|nr:outer membrane beta-barrel protein [Leadbetterella sp.]
MRKIYLVIFILWAYGNSFAQNLYSVTGKTLDENQATLPFVTLMVLQAKDSSIVKAGYSDADGIFKLDGISPGHYLLKTTFMGYEDSFLSFTLDNADLHLGTAVLNPASTSLVEVTVTATKPLFKVEVDRIVVNVENSALAAGKNTLEVLALSPGLQVSPDESSIRFKGKGNVLIMLDGRQTYMSQPDAIRYLKSLSSSEIESIELISNPPAKYDATGVGGIINIKTIKGRTMGTRGSINAGYRRGDYDQWNTGLGLGTKTRAVSMNNYFNYSDGFTARFLDSENQYFDAGVKTMALDMKTHTKFRNQNFMFRNSFNWDISKKWAVGSNLVFSKVYYDERKTGRTDTAGGPGAISLIHQVSDQRTDARTFTANGYFKALLNGSNHELTRDVDYSAFKRDIVADIRNTLFNKEESAGNQYFINTTPSTTDIIAGRLDYIKSLKSGVFEVGAKFSNVKGKNDARFEEKIGDQWVTDPGRTFNFQYNENITASYVSYAFEHKKTA